MRVWLRSWLIELFHPRYSITARLGLALGCVTVVFALLESAILVPVVQERLKELTQRQMRDMAVQLADKLDRDMFNRYREMEILATLDPIRDSTTPAAKRRVLFDTLQQTYPHYAWIGLTDLQGRVVASTGDVLLGGDVSTRPWFEAGLRGSYVGDVHDAVLLANLLPNDTGEPLRFVDISLPVRDNQGRIQGVLGVHLSWAWAREVQESLLEPEQKQAVELLLISQTGAVILNPHPDANYPATVTDLPLLPDQENVAQGESVIDGQRYLTSVARTQGYRSYPGLGWLVVARQPTAVAFAPITEIERLAIVGHAVTLLLCVVLSWLLVQQIAQPLRGIAAAADAIRTGKSTHPLPVITGYDEVARLSQSLTTLVGTLTAHEAALHEQNRHLQHELAERAKAESALRGSEERFRLLVEGVRDYAIVMLDDQGRVESWHNGAEQITGYPADVMLGQPLVRLFPAEDVAEDLPNQMLHTARTQQRYEDERWLLRADGTRFLTSTMITPLIVADTLRGYAVLMQDITQRRRIEEQLTHAQKMDGIGQLAGGIAHDFNNVLTAISGYANLIGETTPVGTPLYEDIREIQQAADRGAALTRQLLTFARQQPLLPQTIDLNQLVHDLEKMLRRLLPSDITLDLRLAPTQCCVKVDVGKIEQVLVNLAVNARDAMSAGGTITIETSRLVLDEHPEKGPIDAPAGPYVQLTVSDTGTGIPPEVRERVFEPFFTTKEAGKGTGLGLATCYGIVKQHGGTIWLYSEFGHGTVVKVYLPEDADDVIGQERSMPTTVLPLGSETIFVVEDDHAVRTMAVRVLRSCGYTVIEATNGSEAVEMIQHQRPDTLDLLLTDLMMPTIGGVATAQAISSWYPALKILFMSGYTEQSVAQQRQIDSTSAMIQKPFTPLLLAQKVRDILDA